MTLSFSLVGLLLLTTLVGVADVNVCECVVNVAAVAAWHSTDGKAPAIVPVRTDSDVNVGVVNVGLQGVFSMFTQAATVREAPPAGAADPGNWAAFH